MASLPESSQWDAGVYQLETTDDVIGGTNGVSNAPAKNLANRTKWLKDRIDFLYTRHIASVYKVSTQPCNCNAATKLTGYSGIEFDTLNLWDQVNSRFKPTIAGFWRISATVYFQVPHPSGDNSTIWAAVFKNGGVVDFKRSVEFMIKAGDPVWPTLSTSYVNVIVYFNGTTDYIEIYASMNGGSGTYTAGHATRGQTVNWIQLEFIRS